MARGEPGERCISVIPLSVGYDPKGRLEALRAAMPVIGHALVLENPWLVAAISLGGGGFAGQVAGVLHGDLGLMPKLVIGVGTALVIFAAIYFWGPVPGA